MTQPPDNIKKGPICTQYKATQVTQSMFPRDIPDVLWQDLAANFFTYDPIENLFICNTFSKYPFIFKIASNTTDIVQSRLQQIFSQCGTPKWFFTNNRSPVFLWCLHTVHDNTRYPPHYIIPFCTSNQMVSLKDKLKL